MDGCTLLLNFERFFTVLRQEGVDLTNSAERALRRPVARLLAVTHTCRMQNRAVLDYLVAAVRSHRTRQSVPSLLEWAAELLHVTF
jgi:hypothetical protein